MYIADLKVINDDDEEEDSLFEVDGLLPFATIAVDGCSGDGSDSDPLLCIVGRFTSTITIVFLFRI